MARERQQYSGDGGHQLQAVRLRFGEPRLCGAGSSARSARGSRTTATSSTAGRPSTGSPGSRSGRSTGPTGGRCWTTAWASTSTAGSTTWRPATWTRSREPYPRLVRFAEYLESLRGQRRAACRSRTSACPRVDRPRRLPPAAAQAVRVQPLRRGDVPHALAPLAEAARRARAGRTLPPRSGDELLCRHGPRAIWSRNAAGVRQQPAVARRGKGRRGSATARWPRRSSSTSAPRATRRPRSTALANCPPEMGLSYPCNACWRYWALAKARPGRRGAGRLPPPLGHDAVGRREQHAPGGLAGARPTRPPSGATAPWRRSSCSIMDIAGIRPTAPGFAAVTIRPQLGDLEDLELVCHTVRGPIRSAPPHRRKATAPGSRCLRIARASSCCR